jgi:hypothetical protein
MVGRGIGAAVDFALLFPPSVQCDVANHLPHPCGEIGSSLELLELAKGDGGGLLHHVFRERSVTHDSDGNEP